LETEGSINHQAMSTEYMHVRLSSTPPQNNAATTVYPTKVMLI